MKLPRTIACPKCKQMYGSADALSAHTRDTHDKPGWMPSMVSIKRGNMRKQDPVCPICGEHAKLTITTYGPRHSCCGLHSWRYKPLVDQQTHDARKAAHAAFDPIWQSGGLDRPAAYKWLASMMNMTAEECHISRMTASEAAKVYVLATERKLK